MTLPIWILLYGALFFRDRLDKIFSTPLQETRTPKIHNFLNKRGMPYGNTAYEKGATKLYGL